MSFLSRNRPGSEIWWIVGQTDAGDGRRFYSFVLTLGFLGVALAEGAQRLNCMEGPSSACQFRLISISVSGNSMMANCVIFG